MSRLHKPTMDQPSEFACGQASAYGILNHDAYALRMDHTQIAAFLNDIEVAHAAGYPRSELKDAVADLLMLIHAHATAEEDLDANHLPRLSTEQQRIRQEEVCDFCLRLAASLKEWDYPVEIVLRCARTWLAGHVRSIHPA